MERELIMDTLLDQVVGGVDYNGPPVKTTF